MPQLVNMVKMIPFFKTDSKTIKMGQFGSSPNLKIRKVIFCVLCVLHVIAATGLAQDKVLIGVATGLTSLEGRESLRAANLAVEEINARGEEKEKEIMEV